MPIVGLLQISQLFIDFLKSAKQHIVNRIEIFECYKCIGNKYEIKLNS